MQADLATGWTAHYRLIFNFEKTIGWYPVHILIIFIIYFQTHTTLFSHTSANLELKLVQYFEARKKCRSKGLDCEGQNVQFSLCMASMKGK